MTFSFTNNLARPGAGVAVVAAAGLDAAAALPEAAERELAALLEARRGAELTPAEERVRAECRNLLRNGAYKPTGRGKPASEYLLGAAREGAFPRVNAPVDVNNLVSLKYLLPISLWDAELCSSPRFEFRLGRKGESYVFNGAGQALDLEDLVCGCELADGGASVPAVTPIKDGLRTKLKPSSRVLLGAIYYPAWAVEPAVIRAAAAEFLEKLLAVTPGSAGAWALLGPGETKTLAPQPL